jgi:hypothetical protein
MKNKTNKFRNAFLIAGFCLLNTISYAQTKEETISWLKEKLEKNLVSGYSIINLKLNEVTPCTYTISFTTTGPGYYGKHHHKCTLPTEGANIINEGFYYNSQKISGEVDGEFYSISNTSGKFSIREGEDNLRERVQKALDHLATFCPKKKETF